MRTQRAQTLISRAFRILTLNPGQSYTYRQTRQLSTGTNTSWPAIFYDNTWFEMGPHVAFGNVDHCQPALGQFGGGVSPQPCYVPFASTSAFNTPLPPNPPLLPNSAQIVNRILAGGLGTPNRYPDDMIAQHEGNNGFSPVYYARSSDPVYTLHCTQPWGRCSVEGAKIHAPAGAVVQGGSNAPLGSDRHLTIVDQTTSPVYVYDLWRVQTSPLPAGGNVTVNLDWGGKSRIDGNGISEGLGQGTAAHFSNLAGLVRIDELVSGEIKHALAIVLNCDNGSFVAPAGGSGSKCSDINNAPPMGARLQLNMSTAEIESLHIPRWKKTILVAMSRYGAFFSDTGTDGYWHFQTESGLQYLSLGYEDQWWHFGQANGWEFYSPDNALVGHWHDDDDGISSWRTQIWSRLRVVHSCVSDNTCP